MIKHMRTGRLAMLAILGLLSACGGGGGSGTDAPTPTPAPTSLTLLAPETVTSGSAVALWYEGQLTEAHWRQLSGPEVQLVDNRTPILGVDLAAAGEYRFELSGQDSSGQTISEQIEFSATDSSSAIGVNARRDRQVQAQADVSLRAEVIISDDDPVQLQWQQFAGPTVTLENTSSELLLFTSPGVDSDTLLGFSVTATADSGVSASDDVYVLVKAAKLISGSAYFSEPLAQVLPYKTTSPFADDLAACLYSNTLTRSCALSKLPLLGMDGDAPALDEVMDRVLVSHPWMGDRFEAFLAEQDPHGDFLQLLRSVSGIVISYDIRPSFYWAATGAIYLDPENLWLLPEERDVINEQADYRSAFGRQLQFTMPWRYVLNDDYAFFNYPRDERVERTLSDINADFSQLLYHELAHANDFFPISRHNQLDPDRSVLSEAVEVATLSDQLSSELALGSSQMLALAEVKFRGRDATEAEQSLSPDEVALEFQPDRANDFYNYTSVREDLAMLFEEVMMQHRFGIQRDVAVTDLPSVEDPKADDYTVFWGQRGRIGEPAISERAEWVLERVSPWLDRDSVLSNLPVPQSMLPNQSWLDNLAPTSARALGRNTRARSQPVRDTAIDIIKPLPQQ